MDFIPDRSELQIEDIEIHRDAVLKSMIKDLGIRRLIPGLNKDQKSRPARQ